MPLWFWILVAIAVLLGTVKLILLPEQRRRRGLPKNTVNMPPKAIRRAEAAAKDPIVGLHSGNSLGGPQSGPM